MHGARPAHDDYDNCSAARSPRLSTTVVLTGKNSWREPAKVVDVSQSPLVPLLLATLCTRLTTPCVGCGSDQCTNCDPSQTPQGRLYDLLRCH